MTEKVNAGGYTDRGAIWDEGSDHDEISVLRVRGSCIGMQYIDANYVKSGQTKEGSYSIDTADPWSLEINHNKGEYLLSVECYYGDGNIQGIQFQTNLRTSEIMGYSVDFNKFKIEADEGKKIIGFHGSKSGFYMNSVGVYVTDIKPLRVEAEGDNGGNEWDDGFEYDNVTKIMVRGSYSGVEYIQFEYIRNGQKKVGPIHGLKGKGFKETFEINQWEKEHLISVEGYYDETSGIIQGLQFKTNLKTSDLIGDNQGTKFRLGSSGYKIVGFHGFADKNLNSLGAYLKGTPCITKLEQQGGTAGSFWDDGSYDGVRMVYVGYKNDHVEYVIFDYVYNGKVKKQQHGYKSGQEFEGQFEIDYPNEFITSVEGTHLTYYNQFSSLIFKTSKGRTSPLFGKMPDEDFKQFVLENKGCGLVGFHGRCFSFILNALGAYSFPLPLSLVISPAPEKLEAQGVNGGDSWDDGPAFDGVRMICVGFGDIGIAFIKFVYNKDHHLVFGDYHGSITVRSFQELELNYPSEYLISIDGSYDKVAENECEVITMLKLRTNVKTCTLFGTETTSKFVIGKEGHKIIGFHGKSSNMLHQIGVYVSPINDQ